MKATLAKLIKVYIYIYKSIYIYILNYSNRIQTNKLSLMSRSALPTGFACCGSKRPSHRGEAKFTKSVCFAFHKATTKKKKNTQQLCNPRNPSLELRTLPKPTLNLYLEPLLGTRALQPLLGTWFLLEPSGSFAWNPSLEPRNLLKPLLGTLTWNLGTFRILCLEPLHSWENMFQDFPTTAPMGRALSVQSFNCSQPPSCTELLSISRNVFQSQKTGLM